MKHRITITCQDDTTFYSFIYSNELLKKLFLASQGTGQCVSANDDFEFLTKNTKAGVSINGYYRKEGIK